MQRIETAANGQPKARPGQRARKASLYRDIRANRLSYLFLLPAFAYTMVFSYLSYPYFVTAFQKFNYRTNLFNSPWIGLKNFEFFFRSSDALTVTWNTLYLNILFLLFGTVSAVGLAVLLNEVRGKRFLKVTQSVMLFPNYISWVIVSYILMGLLSTEYGVINKVLAAFGADRVSWYSKPALWPWILVVMRIWKDAGMSSVIYLAAIAGIDRELYEAAQIDSAGRLQQIRHITVPMLLPTVVILTLLGIGRLMYGDFGMMYALIGDNGILFNTTDIIDTYVFRALRLTGNPSEAMAIGLFQSAIGFIMVVGMNALTKKTYPEGGLF